MEVWLVVLLGGAFLCALQAIRAQQLLASAIWLAAVSALVAIALYLIGAPQVAVIELSVGAGLVTVLFVFAISIAGEDAMTLPAAVPRPLAVALVILSAGLLGWMTLPALGIKPPLAESPFAQMLWQERGLDVLVQVVLIFAGVIGVLGLLGEARAARTQAVPGTLPEKDGATRKQEVQP
ncbi:MAG: DUF4040 domain-containing protein [Anaerolineae bacterium]|nr:DUF4040 domain-containing protein [Anaerolineae bacterium]